MLKEFGEVGRSRNDRLVIMDCDGVLAYRKGSWTTIHEKMGTTDHQQKHYELYVDGELEMAEWSRKTVRHWAGEPTAKLNDALREATSIRGLNDAIDRLNERGFVLGVVSAGILQYVERIVGDTAIDFVVANHLETKNGVLTGDADIQVTDESKADWFERIVERYEIPESNVVLVGDSKYDLRKVDEGNLAIAFNPLDVDARETADVVITDGNLELIVDPIDEWLPKRSR